MTDEGEGGGYSPSPTGSAAVTYSPSLSVRMALRFFRMTSATTLQALRPEDSTDA
jgi:hypothetical protein